ncbi:Conserved_hypothetical protein [Hexamita inflata]|uniref:Uncharacterized protein n=1 Tax=Hexamita inflata TaxID=28002 RepID=A0AA86QHT7_9EUKA|nr:Conserved hypothetical protein [Hexamita inflata]
MKAKLFQKKVDFQDYSLNIDLEKIQQSIHAQITHFHDGSDHILLIQSIIQLLKCGLHKNKTVQSIFSLMKNTNYQSYHEMSTNYALLNSEYEQIAIRLLLSKGELAEYLQQISLYPDFYFDPSYCPLNEQMLNLFNRPLKLQVDPRKFQLLSAADSTDLTNFVNSTATQRVDKILEQIKDQLLFFKLLIDFQQQMSSTNQNTQELTQAVQQISPFIKQTIFTSIPRCSLQIEVYIKTFIQFLVARPIFNEFLQYISSHYDKTCQTYLKALKSVKNQLANPVYCVKLAQRLKYDEKDIDNSVERVVKHAQLFDTISILNDDFLGQIHLINCIQETKNIQLAIIISAIMSKTEYKDAQEMITVTAQEISKNKTIKIKAANLQQVFNKAIYKYVTAASNENDLIEAQLLNAQENLRFITLNLVFYKQRISQSKLIELKQKLEVLDKKLQVHGDFTTFSSFYANNIKYEIFDQMSSLIQSQDYNEIQYKLVMKQFFTCLIIENSFNNVIQLLMSTPQLISYTSYTLQGDFSTFLEILLNNNQITNFFDAVLDLNALLCQYYFQGAPILDFCSIKQLCEQIQGVNRKVQSSIFSTTSNLIQNIHPNIEPTINLNIDSQFEIQKQLQIQHKDQIQEVQPTHDVEQSGLNEAAQRIQSIKLQLFDSNDNEHINQPISAIQQKEQDISHITEVAESAQDKYVKNELIIQKIQNVEKLDQKLPENIVPVVVAETQEQFEQNLKQDQLEDIQPKVEVQNENAHIAEIPEFSLEKFDQNIKYDIQTIQPQEAEIQHNSEEYLFAQSEQQITKIDTNTIDSYNIKSELQSFNSVNLTALLSEHLQIENNQISEPEIEQQKETQLTKEIKIEDEESIDEFMSVAPQIVLQEVKLQVQKTVIFEKNTMANNFNSFKASEYMKYNKKELPFKGNLPDYPSFQLFGQIQAQDSFYTITQQEFNQQLNREQQSQNTLIDCQQIRERQTTIANFNYKNVKEQKCMRLIAQTKVTSNLSLNVAPQQIKPFINQKTGVDLIPSCSICNHEIQNLQLYVENVEESENIISQPIGTFCFYLNTSFCFKCSQSRSGFPQLVFNQNKPRLVSKFALDEIYRDYYRPYLNYEQMQMNTSVKTQILFEHNQRTLIHTILKRYQGCKILSQLIDSYNLYILYPHLLNSNQYSLHDYNTLFNQNQQKQSEFYVKQFGGYSQHSEIVYQVLLHIQSACKRCKEVTNVCQDCHNGIKIEQIKIGKGGSQCKICKCYFCPKCSLVSNMCKECRK